jgi:hypothetical protein
VAKTRAPDENLVSDTFSYNSQLSLTPARYPENFTPIGYLEQNLLWNSSCLAFTKKKKKIARHPKRQIKRCIVLLNQLLKVEISVPAARLCFLPKPVLP